MMHNNIEFHQIYKKDSNKDISFTTIDFKWHLGNNICIFICLLSVWNKFLQKNIK